MTAKEMFMQEGYYCYANNDNYICYGGGREKDYKRIKFKLKQGKLTVHSDITMSLLRAVVKQCDELGWLGETE